MSAPAVERPALPSLDRMAAGPAGEEVARLDVPGIGEIVVRQVPEAGPGEQAVPAWSIAGPAPRWHEQTTPCTTAGAAAWFPESGGTPNPVVKATCGACPFRRRCLADALAWGPEHGWWGGYSVRQVARMRRLLGVARDPAGRRFARRDRYTAKGAAA